MPWLRFSKFFMGFCSDSHYERAYKIMLRHRHHTQGGPIKTAHFGDTIFLQPLLI